MPSTPRAMVMMTNHFGRVTDGLGVVAAGKGKAVIAHDLIISLKTVRNHVSNILTKLQVTDRSRVITKAPTAGSSGPPPG